MASKPVLRVDLMSDRCLDDPYGCEEPEILCDDTAGEGLIGDSTFHRIYTVGEGRLALILTYPIVKLVYGLTWI